MAFQAPMTLNDELYKQRMAQEKQFADKALDDSVLREGFDMVRGGTKAVTGAEIQDRMNPFLSQVLDRYRQDEEETQRRARASRIAGRSGMSAFGTRGGLSEVAAQDAEQERLGTGLANLRFKGFENAQAQVNAERNRQIQGGQTMGSLDINNRSMFAGAAGNMAGNVNTLLQQGQNERQLANTLANDELKRDMTQAGALTQVGALQTAQQQDLINASRGLYDQIYNYPTQVAQGATGVLGSVPQGTTTTADTGRSPFSQALGLGLAVAGLGIPGGGTLLGAGLSGAFPGTFPRAGANGGALRSYAGGGGLSIVDENGFIVAPIAPLDEARPTMGTVPYGPYMPQGRGDGAAEVIARRNMPRPQSPGFAGGVIDLDTTADGDWAMEDARLPVQGEAATAIETQMEPVPPIGDILRKKFLTTDEDGNSPLYDIGVALMKGGGERGLIGDLGTALETAEAKSMARSKYKDEKELKKQAADAATLKAQAEYNKLFGPQSEWGKRSLDRQALVKRFGADSEEVKAFDANYKDTSKSGEFERLVAAVNNPNTDPSIKEFYRRKLEADLAGSGFSVRVGPNGEISIVQGAAAAQQEAVKSAIEDQYGPGVVLGDGGRPQYVADSIHYRNAKRRVSSLEKSLTRVRNAAVQIKEIIDRNPAAVGNLSQWIKAGSQDARDVSILLNTLKAEAAFGNLRAIKDSGATLGAITAPELELLIQQSGALDQAASKGVLYSAMDRYIDGLEQTVRGVIEDFNALDPYAERAAQPAPKDAVPPSPIKGAKQTGI